MDWVSWNSPARTPAVNAAHSAAVITASSRPASESARGWFPARRPAALTDRIGLAAVLGAIGHLPRGLLPSWSRRWWFWWCRRWRGFRCRRRQGCWWWCRWRLRSGYWWPHWPWLRGLCSGRLRHQGCWCWRRWRSGWHAEQLRWRQVLARWAGQCAQPLGPDGLTRRAGLLDLDTDWRWCRNGQWRRRCCGRHSANQRQQQHPVTHDGA